MTDEIGGISAEITGDASSLFSTLQRAETAMREFNSRYGNLAVKITLQAPSVAMLREVRTQIIRGLEAGGPISIPVRAVAATGPAVGQITREAPPVAAAAAPVGPDPRIAALAQANATGARAQYRNRDGSLGTVYPTTGGGAMGGGTGYQLGGVSIGPGARGYVGNQGMDIQRLQEQAARAGSLQEEVERLRAQVAGGPSISRSMPLPPGVSDDPRLKTGFRGPGGRIISADQIQAMYGQAPIGRPAAPSARAAEMPYVPPASGDLADREHELRALMGELGPEAQAEAESRLPAAAGFGRGGGKGGPPKGPMRRVGPEERAQIIASTPELAEGVGALREARENLLRSRAATTVRAPGTFLAGLVASATGGTQARELEAEATEARRSAVTLQDRLVSAKARELDIEKSYYATTNTGARKQIRTDLNAQREEVEKLGTQYEEAKTRATNLSAAAKEAAGSGLRGLAAGFVGGLGASILFGVGMQAITGGIELLGRALAPQIGRLTNYGEVAGEVAAQLAQVNTQTRGLSDQALASVFAQAGFKGPAADQARAGLLQQTQISGGLAAFEAQRSLLEANFNFQHGIGVPGITSSVGGGLFGIGAQKGLIEQVREQLETTRTGASAAAYPSAELAQRDRDTVALINQELAGLGIAIRGQTEAGVSVADAAKQLADVARIPSSSAGLGGSQTQVLAGTLGARGQVLVNATTGQLLTSDDLINGIKTAFKDLPKPAISDLLEIQRPQIEAQRSLFREQAQTQRNLFLPAAFALQQQAQPLARFGAGFTQGAPTTIGGQTIPLGPAGGAFAGAGFAASQAQFGGAFGALSPMIAKVDDQLAQMQQRGQSALEALVPRDQLAGFQALYKQIGEVGAAISGLQLGVQQQQTNFQVAQYNEQLRIARRSQSDLLQLTGREGATRGDNLGLLERQVIQSQRYTQELALQSQQLSLQSNALSLQLAQRQINFRLAVAGFGVPGETAEERAARVEQAKKEAEFAQKQLDIQKEQQEIAKKQTAETARTLPISFKIQDTGFERQLVDIQHQIALINQGVSVTVNTAAAQQAIEHLSALEAELVKQAATYIEEGTKAVNAYQTAAAEIKAITAQGFSTVLQQTATAWGIFLQQGRTAVGGLTGRPGQQPQTYPGWTSGHAAGMLGQVSQATNLLVGEAGAETVAILRNPRSMMATLASGGGFGGGFGGGGGFYAPISIAITGNSVRSDSDVEQLAEKVARRVQEKLARMASQLGLRAPA